MAISNSLPPIPSRSDLIESLERANFWAVPLILVQVALATVFGCLIDWQRVVQEPLIATLAIGMIVSPMLKNILYSLATKRTRVENLRESTRFGQFDKYRLIDLFRDTLARLNLPDERISFFIVAGRSINAMARHDGLGNLFKSLNGIYLHRQTLHKLEPDEVQDIIGHELGHYYKHYLVIDRFRYVSIVLGAMLGLFASQQVGIEGFLGYATLLLIPGIFWYVSNLPYSFYAQSIEYLCDDYGAQVRGVVPSINGLLKLGCDAEVHQTVLQQVVNSQLAGKLNPTQLVETISSAIPYGQATKAEIQQQVDEELKKRASNQGASVMGFLRYAWQSDADEEGMEELERLASQYRKLESIPRLDWESLLEDPQVVRLDEHQISELMRRIEATPHESLFRLPEAIGAAADVHPPLRSRILYLWNNRSDIERKM